MNIRRISRLATAAGWMALLALPARAQAPADTSAPLPSIVLPPALDRVLRDYERGWRAHDARALAELFSSDGFVLQSGRPPMRGRAAIEAAYAGQGGPLHLRALAFAANDSLAFIIGAYGYPGPGAAAGDAIPDMGKFTLTLKRGAGARWMIFSDMDNASRRARPSPPPASGGAGPGPATSPGAPPSRPPGTPASR